MARSWKGTSYRFAPWGPLRFEAGQDAISATVPGSGVVEIRVRSSHDAPRPETLAALAEGLPVTVDGVETFTLRQPRRESSRRTDRSVFVTGPADVVPEGCFLRARWQYSVGLETPERKLVRPRFDLLPAPFLYPAVDAGVRPDLLALWGAAAWHLYEAF